MEKDLGGHADDLQQCPPKFFILSLSYFIVIVVLEATVA